MTGMALWALAILWVFGGGFVIGYGLGLLHRGGVDE